MIQVRIDRNERGEIEGLTVSGHAGHGEYGHDIVCAAVSALAANAVNAPELLLGVVMDARVDEGFLECRIPALKNDALRDQVRLLVEGMVVGIKQTAEAYPENIRVDDTASGRWKR
jgi:uncharacterized protein YsxB (DUF464 family)